MDIDRKILACVDATPLADVVADYAIWAARRLGAPLELLHVLERHVALHGKQDHSGAIGLDAQERLMEQLSHEDAERTRLAREEGRALLSGLRGRAIQAGAATVDSRLRHGDIEETLAEQQGGRPAARHRAQQPPAHRWAGGAGPASRVGGALGDPAGAGGGWHLP